LERDSLPRFAKKSYSGNLRKPRRPLSSRVGSSNNLQAFPPEPIKPRTAQASGDQPHQGLLRRRAGFFTAWKAFFYLLKGTSMFEYKEDGIPKKDNPLRVIRLKNVIVRGAEELTGKPNSFGLFLPDDKRSYFFQAPTADDKTNWMAALRANVTEFMPSSPADLHCTADLLRELPILGHLNVFKECVFVINEGSIIVAANKAACKTFGYDVLELVNKPIDTLFPDPINPDHLVQDGVTHELEAKPHPSLLPFSILLTMGRLQRGHFLVTITPKNIMPGGSPLKDVGRTFSSFF